MRYSTNLKNNAIYETDQSDDYAECNSSIGFIHTGYYKHNIRYCADCFLMLVNDLHFNFCALYVILTEYQQFRLKEYERNLLVYKFINQHNIITKIIYC